MDKKQYNNIIDWTLKHDNAAQTDDSVSTARAIFNNMGIALPQGDCAEIAATLKSDDYMGWKSCTAEEAQEAANNGTAAIVVSDNHIIVVTAEDENTVIDNASVMPLSSTHNSSSTMRYYAYNNLTTHDTYTYSSNSELNLAQMTVNAQYILDYLRNYGWTKCAVAAMLGNMQVESYINPGVWEDFDKNNMNVGFGLVQWTPATNFINWANARFFDINSIDSQLQRILYELENKEQWYSTSNFPMSFYEFTKSYHPPNELAEAFMRNYERPNHEYERLLDRQTYAMHWYNHLI